MKRTTGVKKVRSAGGRKKISLNAVAEEPKRRHLSAADIQRWYKPVKERVTLRLDAEVVAWFKRSGRGYQTRMNQALAKMMKEEKKSEK
jgi:uncharacterized protein (DUF4415 family)